MLTRRELLTSSAVAGAGLVVAGYLDGLRLALPAAAAPDGYGALQPDPAGLLDLPTGFTYDIVTQAGRPLAGQADGVVPGRPDGTASFPGPKGGVYLEQPRAGRQRHVPRRRRREPHLRPASGGGTTTILVDDHNRVVSESVSLAGTVSNCAGGATPWGDLALVRGDRAARQRTFTKNHGFAITGPFARLRRT